MAINQIVMIVVGVGVVLLAIRLAPGLIEKIKGKASDGKSPIGDGIGAVREKLVIAKEDFDATVHFASLRRLHHYVDTLPDAERAKGHSAISELIALVGMPADPAPPIQPKAPAAPAAIDVVPSA